MTDAMSDVPPEQYPAVIREMIRHENDLTNHRTMWLLIVQGLIANACVTASRLRNPDRSVSQTQALISMMRGQFLQAFRRRLS